MAGLPLMRFVFPASLGPERATRQAVLLKEWLAPLFSDRFDVEVVAVEGYAALGRELLSGRALLGWAPPVVAARVELYGGHGLLRPVRLGGEGHRSALVCRRDAAFDLDHLVALKAVWADRDSAAGYLLPRAWVRSHGHDPDQAFAEERFAGSYRAALDEVLAGRADLTALFALPGDAPLAVPTLQELPAEARAQLQVLAFTGPAPSDELVAGPGVDGRLRELLQRRLLEVSQTAASREVLKQVFDAEALAESRGGANLLIDDIVLAASGLAGAAQACTACGARLSAHVRFCGHCGAPAGREGSASAGPDKPPPTAPQGAQAARWAEERKLATVVFADLAGFTDLSSRLEPDAVQELANACFEPLTQEIERRGGTVIKYIGDCVMAAFGVPIGTEADAVRAVQAGLAMTARLAERSALIERRYGAALNVRVGINSGLVMVGAVGAGERAALDIMGAPVNLASRIQSAARPGEVLLGPSTQRLVQGQFELEALPAVQLKGLAEPVPLFKAKRERTEEQPAPASTGGLDAPFKLRERELLALVSAYERVARAQQSALLLLVGEVGLGKARLLRDLRDRLAADPRRPEVLAAGAMLGPTSAPPPPLALIGRLLRVKFAVRADEPVTQARARVVQGVVGEYTASELDEARETAGLLADACGLCPAEAPLPVAQSAEVKDRVFRAFADWVDHLARQRPVCLVLQNLQWADDTSLDFIERLTRSTSERPVLVVAGTRAEFEDRHPHWLGHAHHGERLALAPVGPEPMRRFVEFLLAEVPGAPESIKHELVTRSEGNPECARDFVRLLIDRGAIVVRGDGPWQWHAERLGQIALPETVQGVVQARLDALPPAEKDVLKRAAVVGRIFWQGAVETLTPEPSRAAVSALLSSLEARGLARPRHPSALQGQPQFAFRTMALRDIAYRSLPRGEREAAHRKVASWLESQGQLWDEGDAMIASHFEEGGTPERARRHLIEAARHAAGMFAHREAVGFYERVLRPWTGSDDLGQRADVRRELGAVLNAMSRYDEAFAALDLAEKDARLGGGTEAGTRLAWVEGQRSVAHKDSGRPAEALASLDRALFLLEGQDGLARMTLLGQRAFIRAARGDETGAEADCTEGLRIAPLITDRSEAWFVAAVRLNNSLGMSHFYAGRLDEADGFLHTALALSSSTRDLRSRWGLATNLGAIAFDRKDFARATTFFERALADARKCQRPAMVATSLNNLGQARMGFGDIAAAVRYLEEALSLAKEAKVPDVHSDSARALAEALLALGDFDRALERATEAIEYARAGGVPRNEALAHAAAMDCLLAGAQRDPEGLTSARRHLEAATQLLRGSNRATAAAEIAELEQRFRTFHLRAPSRV
jgi:class 3 adenylate cyclase/ABC-type phosphate/phosphonate transport system substrate-binding protein/tetratricopeptide (TPR) repeat protein